MKAINGTYDFKPEFHIGKYYEDNKDRNTEYLLFFCPKYSDSDIRLHFSLEELKQLHTCIGRYLESQGGES